MAGKCADGDALGIKKAADTRRSNHCVGYSRGKSCLGAVEEVSKQFA